MVFRRQGQQIQRQIGQRTYRKHVQRGPYSDVVGYANRKPLLHRISPRYHYLHHLLSVDNITYLINYQYNTRFDTIVSVSGGQLRIL